jgi:hypothetical protein
MNDWRHSVNHRKRRLLRERYLNRAGLEYLESLSPAQLAAFRDTLSGLSDPDPSLPAVPRQVWEFIRDGGETLISSLLGE